VQQVWKVKVQLLAAKTQKRLTNCNEWKIDWTGAKSQDGLKSPAVSQ